MDPIVKEILKYVIVIGSIPIWLPFGKALWKELMDAIRAEGGLYGPPPSRARRAQIERELDQLEDPLVSEPLAHRRPAPPSRAGEAAARTRIARDGLPARDPRGRLARRGAGRP